MTAGVAGACWLIWRRRRLPGAAAIAAVIAVNAVAALVTADAGLRARYYSGADARGPIERSIAYRGQPFTRIDDRLEFAPGVRDFPLAFFNDVRRFNFYRSNEPDRHRLPFAAAWDGYWWVHPGSPRPTIYVDAPRGRARWSVEGLEPDGGVGPGWHRILIEYSSPDGDARAFSAGAIVNGSKHPFDSTAVFAHRTAEWRANAARTLPLLVVILNGAALVWIAVWIAISAAGELARLGSDWQTEDAREGAFALVVLAALIDALAFAWPWMHQTMVLAGGSDPLTYEFLARHIVLDSVLMTDQPLGHGEAFYYQPLYPYVLAGLHFVFGDGMFGIVFVQRLLVAGFIWAVIELSVLVAGRTVWWIAAGVAVLFGYVKVAPLASTLLSESIFLPLMTAWTALLMRANARPTIGSACRAGVVGGIATLSRSTLLLGWLTAIPLVWRGWSPRANARAVMMTALIASAGAVIGLATLRNWIVARQIVLVSSSGPVNLQLGNQPPPDVKLDDGLAHHARIYDRFGVSIYTRLVIEYAIAAPGRFVQNLGRKALYSLGWFEAYVTGEGASPFLIATWAIAAIGLAMLARHPTGVHAWIPAAVAAAQFIVVVAVFPHVYGDRLILPFYSALLPYVVLAVHRLAGVRPFGAATISLSAEANAGKVKTN